MLYILRDVDGNPDPHSKLVWISADGHLTHMGPNEFTWTTLRRWKSPDSQSNYPVENTLSGLRPDGSPYQIHIKPLFDEQELTGELGGIAYWEGACDILENGDPIGEAYMELTGYNSRLNLSYADGTASSFLIATLKSATSDGFTPDIRPAWPKLSGSTFSASQETRPNRPLSRNQTQPVFPRLLLLCRFNPLAFTFNVTRVLNLNLNLTSHILILAFR